MTASVTVSDGEKLYLVKSDHLQQAQQRGMYRPQDRGMTVVSKDQQLFEVPIADVDAATSAGFKDLLAPERSAIEKPIAKLRKIALTSEAAKVTTSDPQSLLMNGLTAAEQEAEAQRLHDQEELEQATGFRYWTVSFRQWWATRKADLHRHMRGSGISIAIHLAILLLLASLALVNDSDKDEISLVVSPVTTDRIEEIVIEPAPLEITEPTETESEDAPPEAEPETPMTQAVVSPNFLAAVSGDAVKPAAKPSKDSGDGKDAPSKSSVFGTKKSAKDYVFVIDNSNSMGKGRFETALTELVNAINGLNAKQRFYVIFYSDTAYPMMHPNAVFQMVPASSRNKNRMFYWLQSVQLCFKTNGKEAIQAAFNMKPDVIYVLGDGGFTDGAAEYFVENQPRTKTIVHTRGMQVKPRDAREFSALAKAHGGNYKDVGVSQVGFNMWKANPRPKNSIRGPIWGIKLKKK